MSTMPKFEIYRDTAGKFRWRLKAPNGEIIAASEAYSTREGCERAIESVKANAPRAVVVDTDQAWKKRPSKPFRRREGEK